ncbi:ATP-binding cassette domain-containing protein [Spirillospora sp. NPDC052242]
MLEINGLTHSYGDGFTALDSLDLTVADGELLSIVGPSGCGKSTLLRCIAGLIRPTGGKLELNGRPIDGVPDDLAVVFQDYSRSLFPWLTVRDNVALPLRRRGKSRADRRAAAQEALESVGLPDAGKKYPWQLSGGMQQRVSIARALAYRPSLLLMDEPFGSVDAQTREDLEDLVLKVHRDEKMTILLVTHDIDESVYVGDRVVVLNRSPARVHADLRVDLPTERDQIETRGLPEFIRLRAEVGRLVRGGAKVAGAAPAKGMGADTAGDGPVRKGDAGKTEPSGTAKSDVKKTDVKKTGVAKTDVKKTVDAKTDVKKTVDAKADAEKSEVAKAEDKKVDTAKTDAEKAEATKTDAAPAGAAEERDDAKAKSGGSVAKAAAKRTGKDAG